MRCFHWSQKSIWHCKPLYSLQKMEHYGVRGIALSWFAPFLSNRKQYVSVKGHISESLNISCGVPQGSVLGPLLFLIYINDLPNVSKHSRFYFFANGTNIYFEAKDLKTLQKIKNRELRHVKKWLEANKWALNIEKINFVVFHSPAKNLTEPIILKFGRKKITHANYVKFLGVLLDETLSWMPHLIELSRKLARSVGIFYKLRHYVPLGTLISIYYALFYPFLTYGIVVWSATYENLLKPVLTAQKKVIRAITFSEPAAHSSPLFLDLKILKLGDIYQLYISSFVFECHNDIAPSNFRDFFRPISSIHSHNTRGATHGGFFLVKKNTLLYLIRSICCNGVRIWNNIPYEVRNSTSVKGFRKNFKN